MKRFLNKRKLGGLLLAALAAGTWSVPAVGAQSGSSTPAKAPAHKKHSSTSAGASTKSSPASAAKSGHATTARTSGKSSSKNKKRTKKVKGQAAPTPDRINEIQGALAKNGTYTGTPTGKWDDSTVDAMKHFQAAHGLNPSGKLDALTLQKLGLGSETAGLAAPTPPPNTANRLTNTTSEPRN